MKLSEHIHIGMPVFNGETHLAEGLESLLNQTHENFEILMVDNGSTDGTQNIAQAYAKKDSRIKYLRQGDWVRATANWNRAYELAAHDVRFFMWASDDDLWAKDYIESLLPPLLERSEVVLSFSQIALIDNKGQVGDDPIPEDYPTGDTAFRRIRSIINSGNYCPIFGLIRTDAIQWSPCLIDTCFGPDLWFLLELATVGQFHMNQRPLFYKRRGGISETGEDPAALRDPDKTWNIGEEEWNLIRDLNLNYFTKLYTYYRLRISAKALYPRQKKIPFFLQPFYCYYQLRCNPRYFGIRSRLRRTFSPS